GKAGSGGGTAGDGGTARDGASGDAPVVGTNCGAAGQVCCAGNTCKSGGCCVAGMCKANGASCMPANGTCKDGLCGACSGLRVFSWNIAHLGNNGRTAEQLGNLAKRMAGLKPAVMGLQEQEDLRTTRNVVAAMGAQYAVNSDCDETCLVWDTTKVSGIHFKYWSEPLGGMEHSSFRAPLAGVFQPVGGSVADRFIVLSLHAHWNSNDERCAQGRYLRALMQHFLADPESPHDVVFLGDYNNSPSDCPHTTLQPSGAEPIAALLPKSNGDGTYGSRGSPLDHMWVSKSMLTRLVTPDTFVFRPDFFGESYSTFSATCSDHFPIMSQVCQMAGTQTQGTGSTTSTDWVPQKTVCANETGQQGDFGLS
ncbi:MAG: hypothetical protein MUC77_21935, partial [Chromatiaceae bacterium]|nr:hypothetical protein [Chromatiaceae bacterium]